MCKTVYKYVSMYVRMSGFQKGWDECANLCFIKLGVQKIFYFEIEF